MKEIVKVMLAEGIDVDTIHEVLDIIEESYDDSIGSRIAKKQRLKDDLNYRREGVLTKDENERVDSKLKKSGSRNNSFLPYEFEDAYVKAHGNTYHGDYEELPGSKEDARKQMSKTEKGMRKTMSRNTRERKRDRKFSLKFRRQANGNHAISGYIFPEDNPNPDRSYLKSPRESIAASIRRHEKKTGKTIVHNLPKFNPNKGHEGSYKDLAVSSLGPAYHISHGYNPKSVEKSIQRHNKKSNK